MSLTMKFWQERAARLAEWDADGLVELGRWLEAYGLEWAALREAGLIEPDPDLHTAKIYDYVVTPEGRKFIKWRSSWQALLVDGADDEGLLKVLKNT